jgi:DNA-binding transcriptional LysR family regulator
VSLTPDGERLYRRCERVLAEVEDLRAEAAGTRAVPSGTIRIDAPIAYGRRILMPLLAQLLHRHPQLALDVRLQDAYADLVRDGLDLAIRVGALQDSRLVARRIDWQQLVLVGSPSYLQLRGPPQGIEDLAAHAAVVFRMPSSGRLRPWQLRESRRVVELHPAQRVQVNDGDGMVAAARQGLGLMQIPDYMVEDELADGSLVEVLAARRPPPMPISAVLPSARMVPPRVRLLLDALQGLRERRSA